MPPAFFYVRCGATLSHCFAVLVGQTENKRLTSVLREVISDVEQGKSLSEAFLGSIRTACHECSST
ncbi:MAG: hypothetical protein RQM92_03670 [Candidatus Syntrophopropionicum ammoniitolerans]